MPNSWKPFNKKSMPPVNNGKYFLICRGYREPGGGVMEVAKRVQYDDDEPYIRYIGFVGGNNRFDWVILEPEDYRKCLWQEIEYPC